jgi:hypothetical protein
MKAKLRKIVNRSCLASCQICGQPNRLVDHHINGRDIPNANSQWNIASICANDHMLVHEGKLIIEQWVMSTSGRQLIWHYAGEPSITGNDSKPYQMGKPQIPKECQSSVA